MPPQRGVKLEQERLSEGPENGDGRPRGNGRLRFDQRLDRVFQAAGIYVYTVEYANGVVAYTNHGTGSQSVTGYRPEEYRKDPLLWISMVHPDDRPLVINRISVAEKGTAPTSIEHRILRAEGSTRWVRNTIVPCWEDGRLVRCDGLIEDITEKKSAFEELRHSRHFLQKVVDASPDAMFVCDRFGRSILANEAARRLALREGVPPGQLSCYRILCGREESCEADNPDCPLSVVFSAGGVCTKVRCHQSIGGRRRNLEITASPIQDRRNRVSHAVFTCRDITDRLRAESAEQSLVHHEVQLAAAQEIQNRLLPQTPPVIPGTEVVGGLFPAEYTAGDFFDYLTMPDGSAAFVIGDVSGHGFGPALLMSLTHTLIRMLVEIQNDLVEILGQINNFLVREIQEDRFVTLFFARYDATTRSFTYASAGHPPAFVLDGRGDLKAKLESTSYPLGVVEGARYPATNEIYLARKDLVLMLTDGLLETRSPADEAFGENRLIEVLRRHRKRPARRILTEVHHALCRFSGRPTLPDDITAMILKIK